MAWKKKEYWIIVALLVFTLVYSGAIRYSTVKPDDQVHLSDIPFIIDEWTGEEFLVDEAVNEKLKADLTLMRRYVNNHGDAIWLFIGYFKDQKYGSQIHSPKHCLPGGGWKISKKSTIDLRFSNPVQTKVKANDFQLTNRFGTSNMIYWFETRGGVINSEYMLKLDLVKNALLRRPTDAAFIRFSTDGSISGTSKDVLLKFIKDMYPHIEYALQFDR